MKRIIDIIFSIVGMILLSPLFFLLYSCLCLFQKGPVFLYKKELEKEGDLSRLLSSDQWR